MIENLQVLEKNFGDPIQCGREGDDSEIFFLVSSLEVVQFLGSLPPHEVPPPIGGVADYYNGLV